MIDPLEAVLTDLKPVSLDVLVAKAARQMRKDRKYGLPVSRLRSFLDGAGLQVLEIDDRRVFRYESVYFDTPDLDFFLDAAHRRRLRYKVRSRTYIDSDLCWLEVKSKAPRRMNTKYRLPYDVDRRETLTTAGVGFLERFDHIAPVTPDLRPVLTTHYRRATLLEPKTNSRVTIDVDVQWSSPDGSYRTLPHTAIIETKTAGPPCSIDHRLHRLQVRAEDISKYCLGRAVLDPELPANKWNRLLRKYFDWQPARTERGLAPVVWITRPDHDENAPPILSEHPASSQV